jgi:hypothetical protein
METAPSVLLLDDGELDPVQSLLEELGCSFVRVRGGGLDDEPPCPRELIIATARRAIAHLRPIDERLADEIDELDPVSDSKPEWTPTRIAVVREDSWQLRAQLRLLGFDFLVRLPIHPKALRVLLLRTLSNGPERRRSARFPVGASASVHSQKRSREVLLREISRHGCQLVSNSSDSLGHQVQLEISSEITQGPAICLPGNVVRQVKETRADKTTQFVTALEFDALPAPGKAGLERLLTHYSNGLSHPEITHDWDQLTDAGKPDEEQEEPDVERRSTPRKSYGQEVVHGQDVHRQSLIGKDLSLGGMRIEPRSGLEPGDTLRLAFFAAGTEEPFTISARVTRHEPNHGTALQFDPMSAELEAMLEQLITGLPPVEALQDGESEAMGAVLAEILSD